MSKVAKQVAAGVFLTIWKATGYSVKKITRFSPEDKLKTIAIFSTTALGDFILNTPAIAALKARWPDAKLLLVMNQRNEALAAGSNLFTDIFYWNGKANDVLKLAGFLRKHRVDATFILHSRTPYDIIAASLGRSTYIFKDVYYNDYQGQENFALARFLSAHFDNRKQGNIHLIDQKAQLLKSIGIDMPSKEMFIPAPFTPERPEKTVVGIHAGASSLERCWPVEKFAQVIEMLLAQHADLEIVLIGANAEKALNQRIIDALTGQQARVHNLAGTTNLIQLAAKIAGFTCLVVGDTGPLHIAVALKTPTVGLYGGQMYVDGAAPMQDSALHHVLVSDDENVGISRIAVADVYSAINQCLAANPVLDASAQATEPKR